jgi:hypothetical protein
MSQDKQPQEMNSGSQKSNSNRMFIFGLTLLLILALPIMVYKLVHDWRKLQIVRAELTTVQRQADDYSILQSSINKYKGYHSELKGLMDSADKAELGNNYWVERKLEINKRQINRTEAAGFLNGSGRSSDAFFKTALFDLHTVQVGDDLFSFRQGDASEVQLTMNGTFYTKIKQ